MFQAVPVRRRVERKPDGQPDSAGVGGLNPGGTNATAGIESTPTSEHFVAGSKFTEHDKQVVSSVWTYLGQRSSAWGRQWRKDEKQLKQRNKRFLSDNLFNPIWIRPSNLWNIW